MKTNTKKFFFIMATVITAVLCFTFFASAIDVTDQCGENVTYTYNSETKELIISGEGAMENYSYTSTPFDDMDIKTVTVNNGVTTIGDYAFFCCKSLTDVSLPESVTSIGNSAFYECSALSSVNISNVQQIGTYAFWLCGNLSDVILSESATDIGNYAFWGCQSITEFAIPNTVTAISDGVFGNCLKLSEVTVPDSVTSIGRSAFYECESLTQITLPDSIKEIDNGAFAKCTNLASINLPSDLTKISQSTFSGCTLLENITIPDSVTVLEDYAFYGCVSFTDIIIPDSVTTIGSYAFSNCENLESALIPDAVTSLGEYVFSCCYKLADIVIPDSISVIGKGTFSECVRLENITIPDSITIIEDEAFYSCIKLTDIFIPASVQTIDNNAFDTCYNLALVHYYGTAEDWNSINIGTDNSDLTNAERHCNSIISVNAKEPSCAEVGREAYEHCTECDYTTYKEIPATGRHTYQKTTTGATLSANGKIITECSVCDNISKTATIYRPTKISLSATAYTYNGKTKSPSVTVKDSKGNTLKKNTDYTVKYESGRKLPGKYTVTITFKGNYKGTKKLTFKIMPKATSRIAATQTTSTITLKWSKVTGATGYSIYKYNQKTKKYEKIKTTTATSYKVSKLSAGKSYKFRIKAYTKDDGTIWGSYSSAFTAATKPKTPTLKLISASKGKVTAKWSNVSGEDGYQLYFSESKNGIYKKIKTYSENTAKGSKSKLTSGKKYYFKVRDFKKVGGKTVYGAYSSIKAVKVK